MDLPDYAPGWRMAGGALEYAASVGDVAILLPHAPLSRAEDRDQTTWDGAIVKMPQHDLDLPQVCVSPAYTGDFVFASINQSLVVGLAVDQFVSMGLGNFAFFSLDEWRLGWNSFSRRVKEVGANPVFLSANEAEKTLGQIRKPCGILAFSDELALKLLRLCKSMGLRVPGDVHVISIGDTPACLESSPTLSSISMPLALVGYYAAKLCAEMIKGNTVKSIKIPPSGLIIRESTKVENEELRTASEMAHYLRSNLAYPIQMEDVVRLGRISRRQIERVFQGTYGSSPIAYLKELRLEHAKEMLRTSDASLKDVAQESGYRDANHLCRIFREQVGVTPVAYRETHKDGTG